jgi:arsenate reductase
LEPGQLNPLVVEAMMEVGIDISHKGNQGVFDLFKAGRLFSHVISACDVAEAGRCPIFQAYANVMNGTSRLRPP